MQIKEEASINGGEKNHGPNQMNLIKSIIKYGILGCAFGVAATSCTDDLLTREEDSGKGSLIGNGVVFSLNLAQPGAQLTRTATGRTDIENGRPYENEINRILIIFGDDEDKVITAVYTSELEVSSDGTNYGTDDPYFENDNAGNDGNQGNEDNEGSDGDGSGDSETETSSNPVNNLYKAYAEMELSEAEKIAGKNVNVFVVCNPPSLDIRGGSDIQQVISTSTIEETYALGSKNIDRNGNPRANYHFLMTNADYSSTTEYSQNPYKVVIGSELTSGRYNKKENAYAVGGDTYKIPVQRALARFDVDDSNPIFYFTGEGLSTTQQSSAKIIVTLEYFGLVNQSKTLNLFKETGYLGSTKGSRGNVDAEEKTGWDFFYPEVASFTDGVVFDPNYEAKKALAQSAIPTYTASNEYFHNYIFQTDLFSRQKNFDRTVGEDHLMGDVFTLFNVESNGDLGQDIIWDAKKEYKIRRYCLPNTIHEINQQRNGNTTAPVFITRLNFVGGDGDGSFDESQNRGVNEDETVMRHECPIYGFENVFYGVNRELQNKAKNPGSAVEKAMQSAYEAATSARFNEIKDKVSDNWTKYDGRTIDDIQEILAPYMVKEKTDQDWKTVMGGYDYGSYDFRKAGDNKTVYEEYNDFLWFSAREIQNSPEIEFTVTKDNGETEVKKGQNGVDIEKRFKIYRVLPSPGLAKSLTENGFTILLSSDPQGDNDYEYMVYYPYWNRHNDNGNNGVMGAMEFSVVRNNIYKLKVTSISKIGHPIRRPNYPEYPVDPDPIIPNTPDETLKSYFEVDLKVVDWNLKVNDDIMLGH